MITIIGGGIIGLSIGWQLARRGRNVRIVEKGLAGRQASWQAAGMLAPYTEAKCGEEEQLSLGSQALACYPQFLDELREDMSKAIPMEGSGTLFVAIDRQDREELQRIHAIKKTQGIPLMCLTAHEARELEPMLSPRVHTALLLPSERHVNNRQLIDLLVEAFKKKGGTLLEMQEADEVLTANSSVRGVKLKSGEMILSSTVINAAGAWFNSIGNQKTSHENSIRPVKGQILTLRRPLHVQFKHMIRTPRVYLVSKLDGTCRIGASSEEMGFNDHPTAEGVLELLQHACEVFPAIGQCVFEEAAAGLRPTTANQFPLIQESTCKGLFNAAGHGRSGILLAPLTAYMITQKIMQRSCHANTL